MGTGKDPHFDSYASRYDALHQDVLKSSGEESAYFAAYKADYLTRFVGEHFSNRQDVDILDFGCGIGNALPHLARVFPSARLHGVDVSGESVTIAREQNPNVQLQVMHENKIPLADASVDLVTAACVFHHIPPAERESWAREIKRVLKPGGHFFIFEHNPLNPLTQWVVKNCEFDDDAILLPRRESLNLMSEGAFKNATVSYIVFFPKFAAILRPFERRLGWLPLGAQYVAHAVA